MNSKLLQLSFILTLASISCSTVAYQYNSEGQLNQKLVQHGIGEAKFSDGAEISSKPWVEVPKIDLDKD